VSYDTFRCPRFNMNKKGWSYFWCVVSYDSFHLSECVNRTLTLAHWGLTRKSLNFETLNLFRPILSLSQSYDSVVKICNATSSLVRFKDKNKFC
jgi:hypothetical protein